MEIVRITAGILLVGLGLFVYAVAAFGLFRFKYVLNRMHAAALGDTLGILFVLLGLILLTGWGFHALRMGLIIAFLWLADRKSVV